MTRTCFLLETLFVITKNAETEKLYVVIERIKVSKNSQFLVK